ncbi:hypothetical protein ACIQU3_36710 [Streptomyces sp. NPDC101110]|uniref:hypothetical protein n=1 Tax=Streptomyces sp. NPDC101110 TaxID=3366104 RepID=UPI00381B30EA
MSLTAIVTLSLAVAVVVVTYRDEKLGTALAAGAVMLGALYMLLGAQTVGAAPQSPTPSASTGPTQQHS